MPVPDTTPERMLTIRRGQITYIVAESKYDTVVIQEDGGASGTYKSLGFDIVSMIVDGVEQPYVKREHVAAVPGRQDVASAQVATLADTGDRVPSAVIRAAEGQDLPAPDSSDTASPSSRTRKAASDT